MSDITITVTRSAGDDKAVVVFIDTEFEPNASDGGPGLRVLINDHDTYAGKPHIYTEPDNEAKAVKLDVDLTEIAYQ